MKSDKEHTEKDRVFAVGWKKVTTLEMIDIPKTWSQEKPGDRVSNNLLYQDLDKLCLWAHWGTQQGLTMGVGRKNICKASSAQDQDQKTHWIMELATGRIVSSSDYTVGRKG